MPLEPLRHFVGRSLGIRGDKLTADRLNLIVDHIDAKANAEDVASDIAAIEDAIPGQITDALNDEPTILAAAEAAAEAAAGPAAETAVDTYVETLDVVEGSDLVTEDDVGIAFYSPDEGNKALILTDIEGQLWPATADYWSPVLASPVHAEFGIEQVDEVVSGYAFVVTDDDNRVAFGVRVDGSTTAGESGGGGTSISTYPDLNWAHWTDSLGSGLTTRLATLTGRDHYDGGVGGQRSGHIAARMGAVPALVTLTDDEIPASGAATITAIVRPPIRWETGESPGSTLTVAGSLTAADGTVVAGTMQQADGVYTFTRTNAGDALPLIPQTRFIPTYGAAYPGRRQLIIAGRNDMYTIPNREVAQNIAAMLAMHTATVPATILCDVPLGVGDSANVIAAVADWNETWLPRVAPGQYFPLFQLLLTDEAEAIAEITWTATDEANIADGITPESFRDDVLHLNDLGKDVATAFLYAEMQTRGWL